MILNNSDIELHFATAHLKVDSVSLLVCISRATYFSMYKKQFHIHSVANPTLLLGTPD